METTTPTNPEPEASDLQAQCLQLRKLVSSMLMLLVILSLTLNGFLFYQYRMSNSALKELQPQVGALMSEYAQIQPHMDDFVNRIRQYGSTHKDFGPIMAKYGLVNNTVQITPSTPEKTTPAPAPAKAPAKK